ncbi:MAG: DKNYY domain-containing protein [Phycisphaeraceae bacterium]|nr:DKNYY domain-containing protein [Phycisphaeraceae bacterium]
MRPISLLGVAALGLFVDRGDGASTDVTDGMALPKRPTAVTRVGQPASWSLGHGYSRRGDHIEFKGVRIDHAGRETLAGFEKTLGRRLVLARDVHAASFVALSEEYSKDKNAVYYKWISPGQFWVVTIPNADPATFEVLDFNLAKDANRVWRTDVPIRGADAATAQVVNSGWVWKDRRTVYYQFTPLVGGDPATFRHLNQAFYRDAQHVYWSTTRLKDADVNSFRTFGNDAPYAVDKRHVWFGDSRLPHIDAGSFRFLHNHIFADKAGVYVSGRGLPIPEADAATLEKIAELAWGGCVLFRDARREYLFDPYYTEVYTIKWQGDAAVISKPVWFAESDGTVRHVATVSAMWKAGVLSRPVIERQPGLDNKPTPAWEVGKLQRMTDAIREAMELRLNEAAAAPDKDGKPLPQQGDE